MLISGIFVIGIADILMAMSSQYTHFLLVRGLAGIGGALVVPNAFALVGDLFPYERRGMAMGSSILPTPVSAMALIVKLPTAP